MAACQEFVLEIDCLTGRRPARSTVEELVRDRWAAKTAPVCPYAYAGLRVRAEQISARTQNTALGPERMHWPSEVSSSVCACEVIRQKRTRLLGRDKGHFVNKGKKRTTGTGTRALETHSGHTMLIGSTYGRYKNKRRYCAGNPSAPMAKPSDSGPYIYSIDSVNTCFES